MGDIFYFLIKHKYNKKNLKYGRGKRKNGFYTYTHNNVT